MIRSQLMDDACSSKQPVQLEKEMQFDAFGKELFEKKKMKFCEQFMNSGRATIFELKFEKFRVNKSDRKRLETLFADVQWIKHTPEGAKCYQNDIDFLSYEHESRLLIKSATVVTQTYRIKYITKHITLVDP